MADNDNIPLSMQRHRAGLHSVGSYQVSGRPWLTSSLLNANTTLTCSFPSVSKRITIYNTGSSPVRISFADTSAEAYEADRAHWFEIPVASAGAMATYTFDVKCARVYISEADGDQTGVSVYASLTGIHSSSMFPLLGPG